MKVKDLISKLQRMPKDLPVMYSAHDNADWEIAGDVHSIQLYDKEIFPCPDYVGEFEKEWYKNNPDKAVVLRG